MNTKGVFKNHVDRILTFFDHPPTPSGQAWTFGLPPTPCPRGHLENDHPLIRPIQYAPHFAQTKVGIKEISFLCNIYLPKLGLKYAFQESKLCIGQDKLSTWTFH